MALIPSGGPEQLIVEQPQDFPLHRAAPLDTIDVQRAVHDAVAPCLTPTILSPYRTRTPPSGRAFISRRARESTRWCAA
jgi:hypothetical protein